MTAAAYLDAIEASRALDTSHGRGGGTRRRRTFDLLLTPTMAAPPAPLGEIRGDDADGAGVAAIPYAAFTVPFNITGQPAMSVPLAWADGLPIGVQLVAAPGREDLLLRVAAQLETARPWADRRPPVARLTARCEPRRQGWSAFGVERRRASAAASTRGGPGWCRRARVRGARTKNRAVDDRVEHRVGDDRSGGIPAAASALAKSRAPPRLGRVRPVGERRRRVAGRVADAGLHETRAQHRHADRRSQPGEVVVQRLAQPDDRELGRAVHAEPGHATEARQRRGVHHVSLVLLEQQREERVHAVHHAPEVDADHPVPHRRAARR